MIPDWLHIIDFLCAVIIFLFAYTGVKKGVSGQMASLIGFGAVGAALIYAYYPILNFAQRLFSDTPVYALMWLVFLFLCAVGILVYLLLRGILADLFKTNISEGLDSFFGVVLAGLRGLMLIISLIVAIGLLSTDPVNEVLMDRSYIGNIVI